MNRLLFPIFFVLVAFTLIGGSSHASDGGDSNSSAPTPTCPKNPSGAAMPHTGTHPTTGQMTEGTLVCNTIHPKDVCACKKCEFIPMKYRPNILDNVYVWGRLRRASERRVNSQGRAIADNAVERWLRGNLCDGGPTPVVTPPASPTPSRQVQLEFLRPKLSGGDREDCNLISPVSQAPELRARCESELARLAASAGDCSGYLQRRLRQGGHGYGREQDGPRVCELLVASDALNPQEVASRVGGGAMDRVRPSARDREECRQIIEEDTRRRRRCFRRVEQTINQGGQCKYFFAARFRQGETCPNGDWSNTSTRSQPTGGGTPPRPSSNVR
jgi:hypothetical protein